MSKIIVFNDRMAKTDKDVIISSHPYTEENDVIISARFIEDTSDLPQNLYRIRSNSSRI